ncbi:O-antigen polymerase [Bacillus coreaensis]
MKSNSKDISLIIDFIIIFLLSPFLFIKKLYTVIKRCRLYPLIFIEIYVLFTVILFYFGPIEYPLVNPIKTVCLILLYNFALIGGYYLADSKFIVKGNKFRMNFISVRMLLWIGTVVSITFSFVLFTQYSSTLSLSIIIDDLMLGITDPGESYLRNINNAKESSIFTQLMTLLSPLTYLVIPLGLFYFSKLRFLEKVLLIIAISFELFAFIIKGTNFGVFKVAAIFFVVFFLVKKKRKINANSKILIVFAIVYFLFSITNRMNLTGIPNTVYGMEIDQNHLLFNILPVSLSIPIMLGTSYISQGYYGLSLTSLYNFDSTYGFGSGRFLLTKVESLYNIELWERTYQYKMDLLWDSRVNWHTIYVWFANDFGLLGVPIIMALIGFMFCLIFRDVKEHKSVLATILLPLYVLMILFIPANNIIFDNPLMFIPFIFFNILWIFSKRWRVKL